MSVIAVAGGTGKLGRTIVEAILEQGKHRVVVLARLVRSRIVCYVFR
jgi:nucleoside-diphosphate-sugar epimerase